MRASAALAFLMAMTSQALADGGFAIVIPGKPGVPVFINGVDASYAVVEGDWGLLRGNQPHPTVYGGRYVDPVPNVGHYYPSMGHMPGYGRLEIQPPANRKLPPEAESYYRSWSAQSMPLPPDVPANPPPVIVAPQVDYGWQHGRYPRPRPHPH
jgi:hypothetical protein